MYKRNNKLFVSSGGLKQDQFGTDQCVQEMDEFCASSAFAADLEQ